MFRTITPGEMKRIETEAMEAGLCSGRNLMESAATAVADVIGSDIFLPTGFVLAVCGTGNNGGDAMAALRILNGTHGGGAGGFGRIGGLVCLLMDGQLSADAQRELDQLQEECPEMTLIRTGDSWRNQLEKLTVYRKVRWVIDGLFGTGLCREVTGTAAELCKYINQLGCEGARVVSVDIPSGVCGRTGQVLGTAVKADTTVTFHRPKPGLYLGEGFRHSGQVIVADIGLPEKADNAEGLWLWDRDDVRMHRPVYDPMEHKGDHGRVALLCGSAGMAGAAAIAATAALRTGAGLVTVACPERILDTVQTLCPCATCLPLEQDPEAAFAQLKGLLEKADVLGMGCGLGQSPWAAAMVEKTLAWLSENSLPAVIDADGLNLLAGLDASKYDLSRCVLTPHPGEAARLLGTETGEIVRDAAGSAEKLHQQYGAAVALKGVATVMITREGSALNTIGTPALGKGGSGDTLTGILCALLGLNARRQEKQPVVEILQTGCGMLGLAGLRAEKKHGRCGVLATDLCLYLGGEQPEEQAGFRADDTGVRIESRDSEKTIRHDRPETVYRPCMPYDPDDVYGGRQVYRSRPMDRTFPEHQETFLEKAKKRTGRFFRRHFGGRFRRRPFVEPFGDRWSYTTPQEDAYRHPYGFHPDDPTDTSAVIRGVTPEAAQKYREEHGENLWGQRPAGTEYPFGSSGATTAGFRPVTPEENRKYREEHGENLWGRRAAGTDHPFSSADVTTAGFRPVTPEETEKYREEHGENLWGRRNGDPLHPFGFNGQSGQDGADAAFHRASAAQWEADEDGQVRRAVHRDEAEAVRAAGEALGRIVTVTVDRKAGDTHPEHRDIVYPINYGYVQDVLADDNEWQDAYIYGETMPLDVFEGQVVAVIRRLDDVEDKWVVAAPGTRLTETEVRAATNFVEKYFDSEILCL